MTRPVFDWGRRRSVARPLATQQFDVLIEIFDISRAQRRCIEREDLEQLAALMEQRDELLEELRRLVIEEASLPENVVGFRAPHEAAQDALALDTVICGILDHDRKNEELLTEKMDAIRAELPKLRQGMRANAGYQLAERPAASMDRVS